MDTEPAMELLCPDGIAYMPFQVEGIRRAAQTRRVLLADEMGLGKTVQCIGVLNQHPKYRRVLILCPASLCGNWEAELRKWMMVPRTIEIARGQEWNDSDIVILPYTSAWRDRYEWELRGAPWDLVIMDEAHRLKNHKSKQGRAIFGTAKVPGIYGKQIILVTGTPIVNRPIDVWPLLCCLWPDMFGDWYSFVKRYCGALKICGHWDTKGSSNTEELNGLLQKMGMIRRLKRDVLKDLPAKTRQMIVLSPTEEVKRIRDRETAQFNLHRETIESLEARRAAAEVTGDENSFRDAGMRLRACLNDAFAEMAKVRQEMGLAKVAWVVQEAADRIEEAADPNFKLVIFAWHQEVIDTIAEGLKKHKIKCVTYTGKTPIGKRQAIVDSFQEPGGAQVFIGNLQAAGVGITLTSAQTMIFAEVDWVPGNMTQAEDRIHRITQKGNALIIYMVFEASIDSYMVQTFIQKQDVIDSILDPEQAAPAEDIPDVIPKATYEKKAATIWNFVGQALTLYQKQAALDGLRFMAKLDKDGATARNGVGYSKLHSEIAGKLHGDLVRYGKLSPAQTALAASILKKYHKQLPDNINSELAKVEIS